MPFSEGRARSTWPLPWRTHAVAVLVVLASSALVALALSPGKARAAGAGLDAKERKVVKLINRYRARHGKPRLRVSRGLSRVAHRHSTSMIRHDFFAHNSANGTASSTRVRRVVGARTVGENLAFVPSSRRQARQVVALWIRSPGHRAVMLSSAFRRVGVARRAGRLGSSAGVAYTADFASRG